jgi:hypothetical protein
MNKYIILIATVVLGTMISCSPVQKESKQEQVLQQNQVPKTMLKADTSAIISLDQETVPATSASNQPTVIKAATTPPELNPPHGEPFHRCDIPVGSPLNAAAPSKSANVQTAPQINRTGTAPTLENAARLNNPQANTATAPTVANAAKPKLNPPLP